MVYGWQHEQVVMEQTIGHSAALSTKGRPELTSLTPIVTVNIDQQPEIITVQLTVT